MTALPAGQFRLTENWIERAERTYEELVPDSAISVPVLQPSCKDRIYEVPGIATLVMLNIIELV